jgi:hypothetical protein
MSRSLNPVVKSPLFLLILLASLEQYVLMVFVMSTCGFFSSSAFFFTYNAHGLNPGSGGWLIHDGVGCSPYFIMPYEL